MKAALSRFFLALLGLGPILALAQQPHSPEAFLGYAIGERFTYHHEVINYVQHLAEASPHVKLIPYGKSYEHRDLVVMVISSEENLRNLEAIRTSHLARAGFLDSTVTAPERPIVWLSYNVHGNEAACTEAAMATLYGLATGGGDTARWREEMVIMLDPCLNPDGRERYVQNYAQRAAPRGNPDPLAWEHVEPWPGGRYNHYLFDPNRDWCWQTQQETRQRLALFRKWMPHVHADFHEMGHQSSYFFAPAAKPYHEVVTSWQRRFQELIGENHTRYFNQKKWRFFTGEIYDLLYPSYGDTWPMFSGAIGFTYEQGGSGRAGLHIHRGGSDTLHLTERIAHHLVTGFSTVEVAFNEREALIQQQQAYFRTPLQDPPGPFRSFVLRAKANPRALQALARLLDNQRIRYSYAQPGYTPEKLEGYAYLSRSQQSFRIQAGDMIVTTAQPQGRMVKVLFEPEVFLEDSVTYDLTAWALPYAYGLDAYALSNKLPDGTGPPFRMAGPEPVKSPYAYILPWQDVDHAAFLAAALASGLKARYATTGCVLDGVTYPAGTLAFLAGENDKDFEQKLHALTALHQIGLTPLPGGRVARGSDLGSENWKEVKQPAIALITGRGTRATSVGELWHYFEQTLKYPVSLIGTDQLEEVWLNRYDVVIIPDGDMDYYRETILDYVREGGKAIALEKAVKTFAYAGDDTQLSLAMKEADLREQSRQAASDADLGTVYARFGNRERTAISQRVVGSIFQVSLDPTHFLGYGYGGQTFLLKNNHYALPLLEEGESRGNNIGILTARAHVSGFTGKEAMNRLANSLEIGTETLGQGQLIYMGDSPVFRGFWRAGGLLMANAVFFD